MIMLLLNYSGNNMSGKRGFMGECKAEFYVHDLHAADAVYQWVISINFGTMKQLPTNHLHKSTDVRNPWLFIVLSTTQSCMKQLVLHTDVLAASIAASYC